MSKISNKVLIVLLVLFSLSVFAKERTIGSWCRNNWGNVGNELVIGSSGTARFQRGWALPLIETESTATCRSYSIELNSPLSNMSYQKFCKSSFSCNNEADGTVKLYMNSNKEKTKLVTMLGKTNKSRNESCNQILYRLQQDLIKRCDL
jgi:hypothetical protein